MDDKQIFLPGIDQQVRSLVKALTLHKITVLIMGYESEKIARELKYKYDSAVFLVVQESESLLNSRTLLAGEQDISVRLMDFTATDFKDSEFDLIYAQASISNIARNKIVKEIKRILKPGGYFCVGEITGLTEDQPKFVRDMFAGAGIMPITDKRIRDYYSSKGFQIVLEKDLSYTLKEFYSNSIKMLKDTESTLDEKERSFYKKLLRQISHESNIYLKLGGNKYYGFKMLLLRNLQGQYSD